MRARSSFAVVLGMATVFGMAACSNDNNDNNSNPTPTPTVTETATATPSPTVNPKGLPVHLVCPAPIGTVDALTSDSDDEAHRWDPAYVVGTDQVLWPIAFGEVTFTDSTGQTGTQPAETKPNTSQEGGTTCDFTVDVENTGQVDDQGNPVTGHATGTVTVVQHAPSASPSATPTATPTATAIPTATATP